MNILAIRLARLGDVVLLLSTLSKLKSSIPQSRLTLLTGHRCAPVAKMCPAIDEVISVDRIAMRDGPVLGALTTIARLVADVRHRKFDLVVDFHGLRETNLLTLLSGAPRRLGLKRFDQSSFPFCFNLPPVLEDKSLHASQMFNRVIENFGCEAESTHPVVVPVEALEWVRLQVPQAPACGVLVLYIDAPVPERIWPPERFARISDAMVEQFGATVVAIAGPEGQPLLDRFCQSARHKQQIRGFCEISISQVAALIEGATVFISNDTGPMHLGPALGASTLALFSVGLPEHFRPTGAMDHYLRSSPITLVQVEDVLALVRKMWATAVGRDLQR